jgi:cytochrome P450
MGTKFGITAAVLEALAKDLVAAGADTTAAAVTMTLFELMRSPEHLGKVRAEAAAARACTDRLPFTEACVKESLRLHPPAPLFWRVAAADATVGGCAVREGAIVAMCAAHLGRDPAWWGHDAGDFVPERFVDGTAAHAESTARRHAFSYLPFGGGARACLGGRVAMAQVPAIVAMVASYTAGGDLETSPGTNEYCDECAL